MPSAAKAVRNGLLFSFLYFPLAAKDAIIEMFSQYFFRMGGKPAHPAFML